MAEDLEKMNVAALKELARKHLGKGFSRLKTKTDLVAALRTLVHAVSEPLKAVEAAIEHKLREIQATPPAQSAPIEKAVPMPPPAKAATAKQTTSPAPPPPKKLEGSVEPKTVPARKTPSAVVTTYAPEPKTSRGVGQALSVTGSRGVPEAEQPALLNEAPVHQGFFVSRVAGPVEAERHHLTESSGAPRPPSMPYTGYDEQLGELPDVYEDDAELLLPRDPTTLFFLWDYSRDTLRDASSRVSNAVARLRVYDDTDDGETLVRDMDFTLESRSYYVRGLAPGRNYHVEAYFVGDHGAFRRLGRGTHRVALPTDRPSDNLEVRFMRIPWHVPLSQLREKLRAHVPDLRVPVPVRMDLPSSQTRPSPAAPEGRSPALAPSVRVALPSSHRPSHVSSSVGDSGNSTLNPR